MNVQEKFDVIVVGGGHAGVEAAYAAAKMGSKTLLLTLDLDKVASMPCNPSIGGLGKGHIVYEVSALGGLMPKLCTTTYLQARMLNTSKGPAVQGLRLQIDKYAYSIQAKKELLATPNLTIISDMTMSVTFKDTENGREITGVIGKDGVHYQAPSVVVTTGTFMKGLVHVGRTRYKAGRRGEAASYGLSDSIAGAMGVQLGRLKTGTPPRLRRESIDFSQIHVQDKQDLDYLYDFDPVAVEEKMPCYITATNAETCDIIRENLHLSAMYSGNIVGVGPRYCPSIEDKVGRFPGRTEHHVFVEPEGAGIGYDELYPAGLSTSLPYDVQLRYIRSIKGFEKAEIAKCGYAIEYDYIQPNNLNHTLEAKTVKGLFLAGQLNGTTGYEEAAGQGILAGINASLNAQNKDPFILDRSESYIGVMIDDMVTLGVTEPYRMFTSRAERRLLLRQDNVFLRLMPYGRNFGLIDDGIYARFEAEKEVIHRLLNIVRGKGRHTELFKLLSVVEFTSEIREQVRILLTEELQQRELPLDGLSNRALLCIHAEIKYEGYIRKELLEVEKAQTYQNLELPENLDYLKVPGLTKEVQDKLAKLRPKNIAQAQLIQGITPAAISILIFQTRRKKESSVTQSECS